MKLIVFSLIFSLFLSSCSNILVNGDRARPIAAVDTSEIAFYLSIDKFKYYLNEYTVAQEEKIPNEVLIFLRKITVEDLIKLELNATALKDANRYDDLIYKILQDNNLTQGHSKEKFSWGYNFFKTKLNEAFNLAPSKLDIKITVESKSTDINKGLEIKPQELAPEDMTLDSGHYISNRTTRAIFWEANENNRPIEFHLGDSREFLKELKDKNGVLLYEVKPFAKNYNKIYIVQYPGEDTYRYSITNIGGQDRLDHLSHQISLSNFSGKKLSPKVLVKGDIKKFHAAKAEEHALQLRLLPKADRVIIGQKESIDGKFNLFWKVQALKNLYESEPPLFKDKTAKLSAKEKEKLLAFMNITGNFEILFKDKKIIEDAFLAFEADFEKRPSLLPGKFKMYNYDNFTIEMCDYVFTNPNNQTVRWRVISNVWGDEVIPIAEALKKTGHTRITYMGTAGAFAEKDYKVGDLVAPQYIRDGSNTFKMTSNPMKIEGAKYTGSVEHVGSPFEESNDWLSMARARSDFVEVETSYLRRIFNDSKDELEIFLLISDILGSDTETLAHATSGKRKNSQNKLIAKLFERDCKGIPRPAMTQALDPIQKLKEMVFKLLEKKTAAYKYYVFSHLKNTKGPLTQSDVLKFSEEKSSFTDAFIIERLQKIGEIINEIKKGHGKDDFDIAFSKSLIDGTWNPKDEALGIVFKAKNQNSLEVLKNILKNNTKYTDKMRSFATFDAKMGIEDPNMVWMKIPEKIDPDFLIKIYSLSGFKSAGLYKNVTYNGNITLDFLPTNKAENPFIAFYQGSGGEVKVQKSGVIDTCIEAMKGFMLIL